MDCTPYPHYYDLLMPFILLAGATGVPTFLVLLFMYLSGSYSKPKRPTIAEMNAPGYKRTILNSIHRPHCDANVLHAPGVCEYCDMYPALQRHRIDTNVNFTGESEIKLGKKPCPAEQIRSLKDIYAWFNNRPYRSDNRKDN